MKPILLLLTISVLAGCTSTKKENNSQDSVASAIDTVAVNTSLNPALAAAPVFRTYSKEIFTDDQRESAVMASLDSLLRIYLKQKYFSIASETYEKKSWHLDENKQLRIITTERDNEIIKANSIYLFNEGKLIACYSDGDMDGQDTQRNRERIAVNQCPDCGVQFDLVSSQITVLAQSEARVNELESYFTTDYNKLLDWIAQAPIRYIEGNNSIFKKGSPDEAWYSVNTELYNKFIKNRNR